MIRPKITIITPAYNHSEFIAKCISSVLSQTYSSWEQIIIDDASKDDTFKIASSYVKRDKRCKKSLNRGQVEQIEHCGCKASQLTGSGLGPCQNTRYQVVDP